MTGADRGLGHELAAAWLERAGERDAVTLAEHLVRAGELGAAAGQYRVAAEQALEAGDFVAVQTRAARARECGVEPDEDRPSACSSSRPSSGRATSIGWRRLRSGW